MNQVVAVQGMNREDLPEWASSLHLAKVVDVAIWGDDRTPQEYKLEKVDPGYLIYTMILLFLDIHEMEGLDEDFIQRCAFLAYYVSRHSTRMLLFHPELMYELESFQLSSALIMYKHVSVLEKLLPHEEYMYVLKENMTYFYAMRLIMLESSGATQALEDELAQIRASSEAPQSAALMMQDDPEFKQAFNMLDHGEFATIMGEIGDKMEGGFDLEVIQAKKEKFKLLLKSANPSALDMLANMYPGGLPEQHSASAQESLEALDGIQESLEKMLGKEHASEMSGFIENMIKRFYKK